MNKLLLALLFSISATITDAQKVYFIYIQSESGQAFYVKLDNRVISAASSGYLILSKLRDSTYDFSIGFPQNKWPEHKFSVAVNKNDHGFLLKNFGEKGWGLFDLQLLSVQMGITDAPKNGTAQISNKNISPFTEILVKAADDPSLLDKPEKPVKDEKKPAGELVVAEKKSAEIQVVPVEIKSTDTEKETVKSEEQKTVVQGEIVNNSQSNGGNDAKAEITDSNDFAGGTSYKPSIIKKWSESSTTEGFGLVFIDELKEGQNDTIRLLIPNPKFLEVQPNDPGAAKVEKKFIELTDSGKVDRKEMVQVNTKPENDSLVKKELVATVTKCLVLADENDFFQLRKQMAAAENDEDMITAARKYFRVKCFSTQQIKNLGVLFLTDMGKYNFFDAAYNYVTDPHNFKTLETEIRDEYYVNRFRAMIRN
ncbi:MAG TPA: DUF4476 domain-containing protein [Chitinophagaceae bacterium]|nr:DUF4476 domain-containing protein [Chitinophagaceae bacterium]